MTTETSKTKHGQQCTRLHYDDNVVIATQSLKRGNTVEDTLLLANIPSGHKIATSDIAKNAEVKKYGQTIGYASQPIQAGTHVHTHNLDYRDHGRDYTFATSCHAIASPKEAASFLGFRRADNKVGTRNYIGVLTSVNCSATAAREIARAYTPEIMAAYPNVDGVVAFSHATGCGMADNGDGFANLQRVLWGYARNPNLAGVLLVGLGCEVNQIDFLLDAYRIKTGPMFQVMNIQSIGGLRACVAHGVDMVKSMLIEANMCHRAPCGVENLVLALQCGGSDAWSGITANPALGYAADRIVGHGGTVVLAETPEVYGAEHLLTCRAINQQVGEKLLKRIAWWKDYTARNFGNMNNNPSPGNKSGGLTTILEKSLGAVAKAGTSQLCDVYNYGELITSKGFVFMDSPGYDPCSVTGQIASGCNLVAFTTGRGSVFGSKPSPCIKIATSSDLCRRMPEDMDINAGRIVSEGVPVAEIGDEIFSALLRLASGESSLSEKQGLGDHEFVPWQIGATM